MEMMFRVNSLVVLATLVLILGLAVPYGRAQGPAPAPSSDGVAIDQGIAYVLMLVALVLTYIIH
ncbi:hypothetical protein CDL15_Pgr015525 [Punica granatum]|uniref:Arabinogalactan protein 41-like n=1 Tax=Punica granatum TaxID=22663 RepID=A0A218W0U2_PUNGR|nr:hypothetical protein CDL15_Pgr015525 [Punica granatum]PKI49087.1 hypothetical protein CRG98_030539 [Punica granatum]